MSVAATQAAIQQITAAERAQRSVFVGNIPYEATEEQLKDIFTTAGPVVSFRLVYDRETGKPKGYGFCEYQDVETAQSAMRNLNNHDFNGRPLRVGVAAGEQSKDENKTMQQAIGGPPIESPYGDPVQSEKAPEAISKAVASLPPEQMFELMKQMKLCIQNNPNEARNMLLQNPQLAYALLQAQIVMKIVDPQVALAMLHRQTEQIPPLLPSSSGEQQGSETNNVNNQPPPKPPVSMQGGMPPSSRGPPVSMPMSSMGMSGPPTSMGMMQSSMGGMGPGPGFGGPRSGGPMGPGMGGPMGEGPRGPGPRGPHGPGPRPDPNMRGPGMNMGPRPDMGGPPRGQMRGDMRGPRPMGGPPRQQGPIAGLGNLMAGGGATGGSGGPTSQDQEKAALIMQVLQLSDQQIAMLPPDQRQSILILKEQIARSSGGT